LNYRNPVETGMRVVLGWVTGLRYRTEDLERAFFASRFSRVLDPLGYATFGRWRLYGEEALAGLEAALWLHAGCSRSRSPQNLTSLFKEAGAPSGVVPRGERERRSGAPDG
jgi:hypothetical protein